MPWEARRWVIFAILMFVAAFMALNYRPEGAPAGPPRDLEKDRPTVPLTRPGPGETPEPSSPSAAQNQPDAGPKPPPEFPPAPP